MNKNNTFGTTYNGDSFNNIGNGIQKFPSLRSILFGNEQCSPCNASHYFNANSDNRQDTNECFWLPFQQIPHTENTIEYIGNIAIFESFFLARHLLRSLLEESLDNTSDFIQAIIYNGFALKEQQEEDEENNFIIEKYILSSNFNKKDAYLYFIKDNYSKKLEFKKILDNITVLVKYYEDYLCSFKKVYSKSVLTLLIFSKQLKPLSEGTKLVLLQKTQKSFLLKLGELVTEDIMDFQGNPIIINPEKIIVKDEENSDIFQEFQCFFKNGELVVKDYTSNDVKQRIYELIERNTIKSLKNYK